MCEVMEALQGMEVLKQGFKDYYDRSISRLCEPDLKICIGNESCDLDSFISSLALAIAENAIHVVNVSPDVLTYKGDFSLLLKAFFIDPKDLIYLKITEKEEEACLNHRGKLYPIPPSAKLILTDHHLPIHELEKYEVDSIFDHRKSTTELIARRIYLDPSIGSVCTIISKYIGNFPSRKSFMPPAFMAKLLLIPILVDTENLTRRTSNSDRDECHRLAKIADLHESQLAIIEAEFRKAQNNDHLLDNSIILLKDFKKFEYFYTFGASSTGYLFPDWAERELKKRGGDEEAGAILYEVIEKFRREQELDFIFVMAKVGDERLLHSNSHLIEELAETYSFTRLEYKGFDYFKLPVNMSRKIILPKVIELLKMKCM